MGLQRTLRLVYPRVNYVAVTRMSCYNGMFEVKRADECAKERKQRGSVGAGVELGDVRVCANITQLRV